jgi:hypothetical protein
MKYLAAIALTFTIISSASWADDEADRDATPVTKCESLPPSVSVVVMSWSDNAKICREMMRVLVGIRHKDITHFEKAVYVLHHQTSPPISGITGGYQGSYEQITAELVEIIRLRGLYDQPDRWHSTNDLSIRAWNAFNGIIGPRDIVTFLRDAGPDAAKGLSDDGLTSMIALMKIRKQRGED